MLTMLLFLLIHQSTVLLCVLPPLHNLIDIVSHVCLSSCPLDVEKSDFLLFWYCKETALFLD